MPIEEAFVELKIELVDEKREEVWTLVKNNRDWRPSNTSVMV